MQARYILLFLLTLPLVALQAQVDTTRSPYGSYYFDGDDVVFEFDLRLYEKALQSADGPPVDFSDLRIRDIAVSGNFNGWSAEGWKMRRVDRHRYRLRKALRDFTDAPDWQFRFLINGVSWTPRDSSLHKQGVLGLFPLSNPDAYTPPFGDTGNVVFRLPGFPEAQRVILTGSFNNWNEGGIPMRRRAEGWEIHLTLPPGEYEYKFIADGKWLHDPANPETRINQYNTLNSVLHVSRPVRFLLNGYTDAREVYLAGSFTTWSQNALPMQRSGSGWTVDVPLIGGKHLYKFIVDGEWIIDPGNRRKETDLHGNVNSVLMVR